MKLRHLLLAASLAFTSAPAMASPAIPLADPSPYFLDSSTVVQVVCTESLGTAFYIGQGLYITAKHVAVEAGCTIHEKPIRVIVLGPKRNDFAMITAEYYPSYRAIISCDPFIEGHRYFATGYAAGRPWSVTDRLIASNDHFVEDAPWFNTTILRGSFTAGQSGGPVSDEDGVVHGIVSAGPTDGETTALTLAFHDTSICKK